MATKTERLDPQAVVRWQAVIETWLAIQWGQGMDRNDKSWGFNFEQDGLRAWADFLKVPYAVALLLNNEITPDDLVEWDAFAPADRAALLAVMRRALAERWDTRECDVVADITAAAEGKG